MTASTRPAWFAADHLFQGADGWYIGAEDGYRIGPYPIRSEALRRSQELVAKLERCQTAREQVRLVRTFLHGETRQNRRQVRTGSAAPSPSAQPGAGQPPVRAGESPRTWFRTSRFFIVGGGWFFSTRENIDVGPYQTREEAERDAGRLVEILQTCTSDAERRLTIMQFKTRPQAR
ncbi:MAG TPA: DUF6316 family protein [Pseudomonadales bacterium]